MSDTNIAVVQLLYNAFRRADIETILGSLAPDVEWHSGGEKQDYPIFGPRKGIDEVQEFFRLVQLPGIMPATSQAEDDGRVARPPFA